MSTKNSPENPSDLKHPEQLEKIPGVRVTRRVTLHGAFASAFLMALGAASGCDSKPNREEEEDDNGSSGSDEGTEDSESKAKKGEKSKKNKGGKKGKKGKKDKDGKSSDKSSPEDDETSESEEDSKSEDEGESKDKDDSSSSDKKDSEDKGSSSGSEESGDSDSEEDTSPLRLEEILSMIVADAQKLVKNKSMDEDAYQKRINRLLARLDPSEPVPKISAGHGHNMRPYKSKDPIQVFVLEMAPRAVIPLHDHGNRIGNLVVWRGTVKTKNYTRLEKGDNGDNDFLLQETDAREIKKLGTGYLSRVQNNFHRVEAGPRGCTMLDLFTYYTKKSNIPGAGSRWARLGRVVDKEKKIYKASYSQGPGYSAHDFDD